MLYPLSYEGIPLYVRLGYRASVGSSGSGWLPRSRRSVPRAVTRPLAIHPRRAVPIVRLVVRDIVAGMGSVKGRRL